MTPGFWWDVERHPYPPGDEPDRLDLARVDPEIRELVAAVNGTGWMTTVQSCAGHTGREEGPWLWVRLASTGYLDALLAWVDAANDVRCRTGMFPEDRLIDLMYRGQRLYWEVRGRYISERENETVRTALLMAIGRGHDCFLGD